MRNLAPTLIGACALTLGASTAAPAIPLTAGMGAGRAPAAKTDPVAPVYYRYYGGGYYRGGYGYYRPYRYYRSYAGYGYGYYQPWRYTRSYPAYYGSYYGSPSGSYAYAGAYAGNPSYYSVYSYPYYSYPRYYDYYRPAFGFSIGW